MRIKKRLRTLLSNADMFGSLKDEEYSNNRYGKIKTLRLRRRRKTTRRSYLQQSRKRKDNENYYDL